MSLVRPRRAVFFNGLVVLILALLCGVVYNNILHLYTYHLQQQTRSAQVSQELGRTQAGYKRANRRFERSFDAAQAPALLKEKYGLVNPRDLQIKWEKNPS
ncbi:hypothetical protein [Anthocerotibacter panamensis]|uniref:hypothetical protein n=1 Tax=Anthocerotibacter panamensis TaxID=2857077 RepID=UPI001C404B85|nr:hypothetical protein [Anthocerotibacter panamensis]